MKKSKLLVLGLIALMLAGGLVLAGCSTEPCPDTSVCGRKANECYYTCSSAHKEGSETCGEGACGIKWE